MRLHKGKLGVTRYGLRFCCAKKGALRHAVHSNPGGTGDIDRTFKAFNARILQTNGSLLVKEQSESQDRREHDPHREDLVLHLANRGDRRPTLSLLCGEKCLGRVAILGTAAPDADTLKRGYPSRDRFIKSWCAEDQENFMPLLVPYNDLI